MFDSQTSTRSEAFSQGNPTAIASPPQRESQISKSEAIATAFPVLLVGHGSRSAAGRQAIFDLAEAYRALPPDRPVIPCFLELTTPSIADGVDECVRQGLTEVVVLPVLLFGARHNKFDVTNELDAMQRRYPQMTFHYGAPMGITSGILEHLRSQLATFEAQQPTLLDRSETVLLFVGRGSSDPEANGEACKLARMLWEGSGYQAVEVCFIGITHPRLDVGLKRSLVLQPKRIVVVPYLLFEGILLDKIRDTVRECDRQHPDIEVRCLPNLGIVPAVLEALQVREQEAIAGAIQMNCHLCKFRL
ncbi:MAG: sirohydrochlorin chelatase, partial [Cyanobacteria bacterium J06639_1]